MTPRLPIDIRNRLLPGGRLSVSSGTTDAKERDARRESLLALIERGADGLRLISALKARKISILTLHRAVLADRLGLKPLDPDAIQSAPLPRKTAPKPLMLGQQVDRFLQKVRGTSPAIANTADSYEHNLRSLEGALGVVRKGKRIIRDVEMGNVTIQQAEEWLLGPHDTNNGRPWMPATQKRARAVARQVWAMAIREDEHRSERQGVPRTLTKNVWMNIRAARVRKTRVVFLTRPEAARLLRAVKGRPLALWVALGLYGGLRAGEAANLRPDVDVDLERGVLRIQSRDGEFPWLTKTDNSVRDVPIHPALARFIRAHVRNGYAGARYLIHPAGKDAPLHKNTRQLWTRTAFEAAGIRYGRAGDAMTFHTLRHSFVSWLVSQDVQLKKVALLVGDTTAMIDATYAHLLPGDLDAVIRKL